MSPNILAETPITPAYTQKRHGGTQDIYRFANGYGASVIRNEHSYGNTGGLFELGVTRLLGEGAFDFRLTYETPITDDVIGYLTTEDVQDLLVKIQALEQAV